MNLFEDLKKFKKKDLNTVDVIVRLPNGKTILERKNQSGYYSGELELEEGFGFVNDPDPDLHIAKVLPGLYLGSQDLVSETKILEEHGIKYILNCSGSASTNLINRIKYSDVPILDIPETNLKTYFGKCFNLIDEGRSNGSILVHCNAGVSRSVSIIVAYIMNRLNMTFAESLQLVKCARPSAKPNDGFMKQLKEYEQDLCIKADLNNVQL